MKEKEVRILAYSRPEMIEKLKEKFNVIKILQIQRRNVRNSKVSKSRYRYDIRIQIRTNRIICKRCKNEIRGRAAYCGGKPYCQKCYEALLVN